MPGPGELKGFHESIQCSCGEKLPLQVCRSTAGYYIGYYCYVCGPAGRETAYYAKEAQAIADMNKFLETGKVPDTAR